MERILLVDDALFMRRVMRGFLEKNGYEICGEAGNGYEALVLYEERHPDLVILDITMPGMDGISVLHEILELDSSARVVMASAMGQEDFIKRSMRAGAKNFLVKPVVEKTLIDTIKSALQQ